MAKGSNFAVEALAGLAATENFSSITLKNANESPASTRKFQPYKDLMLILIKGRRNVQVRLVEPVVSSINAGDNYVLVTKSEVIKHDLRTVQLQISQCTNFMFYTTGIQLYWEIQQCD